MPRPTAPRVDAAQRDARAMELRAAGATYRQIADLLGVSVSTAWTCVDRGLMATRQEPAEKLRPLELVRLDHLQAVAVQVLRAKHVLVQAGKPVLDQHGQPYTDHGPVLAAINSLLRISERRAQIAGLDAPRKVDAKVDGHVTIDQLDAEIRDLEAELVANDPAYPAQQRRDQEHARDLRSFRTRWQQPGHGPLVDVAGFIAEGLDLALGQLDLDDGERERVAVEVEQFLWERADGVR